MRQAAVSVIHLDIVIVNVGVIIEGLVNVAAGWWQRMLIKLSHDYHKRVNISCVAYVKLFCKAKKIVKYS